MLEAAEGRTKPISSCKQVHYKTVAEAGDCQQQYQQQ
jgi:hypothetical protein